MIVDLPSTTTKDISKRLVRLRQDVGSMALSRVLTLVLVVDGVDYPLATSECAVWPSSHAHTVLNDGDVPAVALGFATEAVHR